VNDDAQPAINYYVMAIVWLSGEEVNGTDLYIYTGVCRYSNLQLRTALSRDSPSAPRISLLLAIRTDHCQYKPPNQKPVIWTSVEKYQPYIGNVVPALLLNATCLCCLPYLGLRWWIGTCICRFWAKWNRYMMNVGLPENWLIHPHYRCQIAVQT